MSYRITHLTVSTALILAAGCNIPCGDDGVAGAQHECPVASASESETDSNSNSNTETDSQTQTDSNTNTNTDTTPSGSESESDSDMTVGPTNSNTDTDTVTNSNTDTETTDTESNTITETTTETTAGEDLWCADKDMDGFGDGEDCVDVPPGEDPPDGSVNNGDDCDDDDETTHPGAAENEPELCTNDDDDDGWGDSDVPDGVDPGSDCNDNDPIIYEDCLCKPDLDDMEDPVCTTPEWGFGLLTLLDPFDEAEWVFNEGGDEICEPNNGPATSLVCDDWELDEDGQANVIFEVKTETDQDWIGFVFGWQDFGHFYSFTWKRGPQLVDVGNLDCLNIGTYVGGMMVKSVDAIVEGDVTCRDMHADTNTLHSELLWHPGDSPDTNQPWEYNTRYLFNLDMSIDQGFILTITNLDTETTVATIQSDDMKYPNGKFGLFSASQEASCFSGFATAECE